MSLKKNAFGEHVSSGKNLMDRWLTLRLNGYFLTYRWHIVTDEPISIEYNGEMLSEGGIPHYVEGLFDRVEVLFDKGILE